MIPSYNDVAQAYDFLARRYSYTRRLNEKGVRAALELAELLSDTAVYEPPALYFSLVRYASSLGPAPHLLAALLTRSHARTLGWRIVADDAALRAFFVPIASNAIQFTAFRTWFLRQLEVIRR